MPLNLRSDVMAQSNYDKMEKCIEDMNLSGKEVLDAITDWHGLQILSDWFIENLRYCEGWQI